MKLLIFFFFAVFSCIMADVNEEELNFLTISLDDVKVRGKLCSNEIFLIAQRMKHLSRESLTSDQKKELKALILQLPEAVRIIVWGFLTRLATKGYSNQYMYATTKGKSFNNDRRNVFAWRPGGGDPDSLWKFSDGSRNAEFLIYNYYFGEYLYASEYTHNEKRRHAFTWIPGHYVNDAFWHVDLQSDCSMRIRSQKYYEFLYTSDLTHDDDRRYVFTWRSDDVSMNGYGNNFSWKLIPYHPSAVESMNI
jgi:hypothetical protein